MSEVKIKESEKEEQKVKPDGGISGYCHWVLKDAKTGKVEKEGTTKNTITARGLDWIIAHVVSGQFPGSSPTEGQTSTYHGLVTSVEYIVGLPDTSPFKYLNLLYVARSGDVAPVFSEGRGDSSYYHHKNTGSDGVTGIDVVTYDEKLGDSGSHSGNSHLYSTDVADRTIILGSKALASVNAQQSIQSNEDVSLLHFQKISLVFNFTVNEGNAEAGKGINSIAWSDSADCKLVGARLQVNPLIPKTINDTLDITYTFDLSVS